ncbi:MAG: glycosyltransferase family 4 protein [Myxococcales bacterium]|nr:glycosyltransferase family 4 protein [Myxococcales bacterium]
MRIACVTDEPMPSLDTATVQVVSTLSALARQGADVELFLPVPARGPRPDPEELRAALIERYRTTCGFALHLLPGTVSRVRAIDKPAQAALAAIDSTDRRFDLLYSRLVLPMLPALARRRPVLFETYRPLIRQYPLARWPLRLAARRPGFLGIVTHSDYSRRSFEEEGLPPEKLRTIYNGYDDHAFARLVTPAEARAELGLPEKPTIVYAGRIAPFKQIDLLLDAYEHMPHGTQLILAGAIDTAEAQPLVERARELGAILPGYLTGEAFARALMAGEIVTIPPSARPLAEFGNTVLPIKTFQYLAAGRVLVVGDTPDTAELLIHDVNSLRVRPDDRAAYVDALTAALTDEALRARLGAAARARAADLTWDARAKRLLAFMEERLTAA